LHKPGLPALKTYSLTSEFGDKICLIHVQEAANACDPE